MPTVDDGGVGDLEHADDGDTGPIVMLPIPAMTRQRAGTDMERGADDGELAAELERLARLGDRDALRHFRSALDHPAAIVQIAAARGFAECGSAGDVAMLIAHLRDHAPPSARSALVDALGRIGDASAIPALAAIVRDSRARDLHAAAADALGRIGDPRALPALDALVEAGDPGAREAGARAAQAIRLHRSRETYDPLARLTESLARLDALLAAPTGDDAIDPRPDIADPDGALVELGVTFDGVVPRDLQLWARWCNRAAPTLRWAASRGWHFLALADALALRAALRLADPGAGAWLPIMASEFGDHQLYVPRGHREGLVFSVFHDEPFRPAGPGKSLADHAAAVIDAWTVLNLPST